jgi:hypothetical protein
MLVGPEVWVVTTPVFVIVVVADNVVDGDFELAPQAVRTAAIPAMSASRLIAPEITGRVLGGHSGTLAQPCVLPLDLWRSAESGCISG